MTWGRRRLVLVACLLTAAAAHGQAPPAPSIPVGLVGWPIGQENAMAARWSAIEECLAMHIGEVAPQVLLTRQRAIRDALFPLLEPVSEPATEQAFAALLSRQDVRDRLARLSLRYLVAFTGGTVKGKTEGAAPLLPPYGFFGFTWNSENTALNAAVWVLDGTAVADREQSSASGTSATLWSGPPIPIPARTEAQACKELGIRIGLAIRQIDAERR